MKKRPTSPAPAAIPPAAGLAAALTLAILVRSLVGLGHYSGEASPPKHGDYEAQRHWMELAVHLPIDSLYSPSPENDLMYWGLDYPPLSAYQSRIHGLLLNSTVPEAVALGASRGFESLESKLWMRWTVLISDIMIFFPAAVYFVWVYMQRVVQNRNWNEISLWLLLMILLNPCLILIDHGHFQYNCISLGLTLGAIAAVLSKKDIVASILFVLSVNHKQMSFYFAPAFLSHLLGKCLRGRDPILNIIKLGFAVLATFAVVWWPYLRSFDTVIQVFSRLVPFERGIYEDYVANFWCSTSVLIKWKRLFTIEPLRLLSLIATVFAFLPSFIQQLMSPSDLGFLYSLLNCSFSFYLFSYQVHEKSILLPLLPASLLALREPQLYGWFTYFALLSMYPLIHRDHLILQYVAVLALFYLIFYNPFVNPKVELLSISHKKDVAALVAVVLLCSTALQVAYLRVEPPAKYPFLFEAIMMLICFSQFVAIAVYTNCRQWNLNPRAEKKKNL